MNNLDDAHQTAFRRAMSNILLLHVTENAFAQLIDGLPTKDGFNGPYAEFMQRIPEDHPVIKMDHNEVCDSARKAACDLRDKFDISVLSFEPWVVEAFQSPPPETGEFHLRLIELVVIDCHQIAAHLYEQDYESAHTRNLHPNWYENIERRRKEEGEKAVRFARTFPLAFTHPVYCHPERCPRGEADIAGYWAEGQIFGGVVVFDRGESGHEVHSMWLHGQDVRPNTLYTPKPEQSDTLISYLLSAPKDKDHIALRNACPLPIRGTPENRPRWDPYEGLTKFNIFRDKDALEVPSVRWVTCHGYSPLDWPEIHDFREYTDLQLAKLEGKETDPKIMEAVQARCKWITPTSPEYNPMPDWVYNSYSTGPGLIPFGLR